ncbi:MAG: lysophospholipid acyltransferase family protein [Flavobacteriales bacterium]|jgi:KDO2-lipid IV(A) lauroyltransferase|nr:lysophospholipid acyltransferase family protein [Flavobacteriales bacterium]MBT6964926.1 lysophospholipid acyltransferase family protein [Flavobacteriales bacterium]
MITKIFYYILILPLSLLPYPLLYLLSDIIFLIMYRVIGYRKEVVFTNLKNSFPNKSKQELKKIMSDFYRHLCDIIMESVKGFTISEKQLRKRLIIKNPEFSNYFADKRQSIIFVGGHYNNWEICAQAFAMYSNHKCIGIYKPLSNAFINDKIYTSRSKYGMHLISMKQTKKSFEDGDEPKAIVFGSDQNPANPKRAHWVQFLNQDTGVLFGVERYAKEYDWPVVFVSIRKAKRGYYEVEYSLVTDNPNEEPHGKITEDFTKRLEQDIINQPQYWLWSHKRWKHKR